MKPNQQLYLFDGEGYEVLANILAFEGKNKTQVEIIEVVERTVESPLQIHLGQSISKGDRMEFTIQKSVELGVSEITPIWAERCEVKLKGERLQKKVEHWQSIAVSACEQCGRNVVPKVNMPVALEEWVKQRTESITITLHHRASTQLNQISAPDSAALLIGPEGGLTAQEIEVSEQAGFESIALGPRVLRTETASLAVLTLMQYEWGDV
jgi:16S rRNA (uracil1498-N3)-methyltransferase